MWSRIVASLAVLTISVTSSPVAPVDNLNRRQEIPTATLPACAQVSVLLNDNEAPTDAPQPTEVPADLAHQCLLSIPINATSAKAILFELPLYLNWQSTLDVLKDPPSEYVEKVQGPIDILAGLDDISAAIDKGDIVGEWEFGWALYKLLGAAHDGHLAYILDVVGLIFSFNRPLPLVSVSEDGSKLPAIFAYSDVLGLQFKNISYTPSAIVKIDGQDASAFLEDLSQQGSLQDRDALYNNLFYSLAQTSLQNGGSGTGGFTGGGRGRYVPLKANTTIDFANGTTLAIANTARTYFNFQNITSGADLRRSFVNDGNAIAKTFRPDLITPVSVLSAQAAAPPPGYPVPVVPGPQNLINGFYIDGPGYENVAVLQVPSFVSSSYAELPFQATSQKFLQKAWSEGKTKLIIDLQANGGGTILQGYDLFKQLFPALDPYGGNRFRYNSAVDLVGQAFSGVVSQYPRDAGLKNATLRLIQTSYFDYHTDQTVDGKPFESWAQKVGPNTVNGDDYTSITRWNLTDVYIPYQSGINITGFSNLTRWKSEDIVLVTDGYCASTCSIFSELMTQQGRVKTIAFGGRSNSNRIQAVGGVKGANVYQWSFIQQYAVQAIYYNETFQDSALKEYSSEKVINRGYGNGINVRDAVRLGDDSGIALQFKYEEADCRLYYTPEMTVNAAAIWKAAADAQWSDSSKCIGNGGYYNPSNARRAAQGKTTTLSPARGQMHGAQALRQMKALEDTFSIETEYQIEAGDGFMQP
ncbi:hypothetical protein P171DRAFT_45962 [Karstenula rhodostoma CBS 690.94]|uniref:Tail specific protease domain-containing protein n=1 Tax=Karstenula rhodostoma CBS 690.94 TaxID=1392251 RepID=A0A9P4PIE8_9PLEO|nr:hypothetical protein P171DRAFT_45962 [Karstenula rhodostoma CBS 690.94]